MRMRKNGKFNFDEVEDPIASRDGSDEEANEDLSLKILEKALSRRDSKETSSMLLNGKRTNPEEEEEEDAHQIDDEVEESARGTCSNMVLKKLLRGARYFDPPESLETCYSCGEQGHITINCPTPTTRKKPCFICGSLEHGAKQCTKGHDCYICKKAGHRAKDCPDKYKSGSKSAVCLRCGHSGHDMMLCKYEYSREDLKDIQCYVCKRFGHLCCVEPGNSPSWSVSCYRCGQLGHIGLACGRYYEESTEKGYASSCFRCGEEGHFSRKCPNSSSISTSYGRDSPSLCYRCNGAGHFARECPNSSQVSKRNREISTPSKKSHKKIKETPKYNSTLHESNGKEKKKKKNRENSEHYSTHESNGKEMKKNRENSEHYSTPHESNGKEMKKKKKNKENSEHYSTPHESNRKVKKKKKTHKGEQPHSTPRKPKERGGWITEDPEEDSFQRGKLRRQRSPITPSGHNHHRSPIKPSGHIHHRSPSTYMGGHNYRSPTFHSCRNFPGSRSTTPYGRNRRNSSFESSGLHQNQRYAPAPSRYGSAHQHDEFQWNYGGW